MTAPRTESRPWECRVAYEGGHWIMTRQGGSPLDPVAWTYNKKLGHDIAAALNEREAIRDALRDLLGTIEDATGAVLLMSVDGNVVAAARTALMNTEAAR